MITRQSDLEKIRLGGALVLGMAVSRLYPDVQLGSFGLSDEGFYYDFKFSGDPVSEYDLQSIEDEVRAIIEKDLPIKFLYKQKNEAIEFYLSMNQPFKIEELDEMNTVRIGLITIGDNGYTDIVKEQTIFSTKEVGFAKVLSVAGAYWKGNENRPMLTRIYATTFPSKEELDLFLAYKDEALKRDHRILGKKLGLYMTDQSVGSGLILWQPRGAFIKHQLEQFIYDTYIDNGFMPLETPHVSMKELFEQSGQGTAFGDIMFGPWKQDGSEEYFLRPTDCPMHMLVYKSKNRSYRELPWRVTEIGEVYCYERSSELQGLLKSRGFTQDTCHTVCSREQLDLELEAQFNMTIFILRTFGLNDFEISLNTKMPKKIQKEGFDSEWDLAISVLKTVVRKAGYSLKESDIPSSFFGPMIEIILRDSLKRQRPLSTLLLDVITPKKMQIEYMAKEGLSHTPYVIHRNILGSIERFIGILLEHTSGNLPLWLQFEKCRIVPVNSKNEFYAEALLKKCREAGIFASIDYSSEPLEGKIKQAEEDKLPYILVVGEKEQKVNGVAVRIQGIGDLGLVMFDNFLASIVEEVKTKSIKTLLT